MFIKQSWFTYAAACLLGLIVATAASAQLASRPAEEWKNTLEQQTRVEGLKIGEIVTRLGLKSGQVVADLGEGGFWQLMQLLRMLGQLSFWALGRLLRFLGIVGRKLLLA